MRKGIASALLSVAETELKNNGTNILFLEVAEDNHPAINFYKKEGFEPIGRRPSYYRRALEELQQLLTVNILPYSMN